jgi:hypothetical protein
MRSSWIWGGFLALCVLHHDFWWWGDRTLVMGILPIGLAYHAAISVAASVLWALASRYAWPEHIEAWADQPARGAAARKEETAIEEGRS